MFKILVPVNDSASSLHAVRHVAHEFGRNSALEVHLLNVQLPLSQYVARFLHKSDREIFYRDGAEKALLPARQILERLGVPCESHTRLGNKAPAIADMARRLGCDRIIMGTARKNSLSRFVEDSTTNRLIELTSVPVEIIAGDAPSRMQRYGVPAGAGAVLASLFLAAAD